VRLDERGWQAQLRDAVVRRAPDGVYVCGYGDAILAALRLLRGLAYRGTICTTSAFNAAAVLTRAGPLAEGIYFPLASLDLRSPAEPAATFVARYRAAFGLAPDIYAAHGYDAALAAVYALAGAGERTGAAVARQLRALAERRGVMGPIAFDEYGNIRHSLRTHWIRNGRVEEFGPDRDRAGAGPPSGGAR
jgi:branched-chain amino acid transport system substrate-binding protein